jgi:hypothetical protein
MLNLTNGREEITITEDIVYHKRTEEYIGCNPIVSVSKVGKGAIITKLDKDSYDIEIRHVSDNGMQTFFPISHSFVSQIIWNEAKKQQQNQLQNDKPN